MKYLSAEWIGLCLYFDVSRFRWGIRGADLERRPAYKTKLPNAPHPLGQALFFALVFCIAGSLPSRICSGVSQCISRIKRAIAFL